MEIFRDGANADKAARDFAHEIVRVPADRKVNIKMAPGGGWVARITRLRLPVRHMMKKAPATSGRKPFSFVRDCIRQCYCFAIFSRMSVSAWIFLSL